MLIRRHFLSLTAAIVAISATSGLSIAQDAKPVSGGKLTWGVETEPATLNPQLNGQDKTKLLLRNTYESLLARTAYGGYVPWLATEYKISEDGKTYTFKLRDNVTFTDGQKFDAQAVIINFTKLKDAAYSGSVSAGPVARIVEAKALDVLATIGLGTTIIQAAGLSFLGMGPQPPAPEWGAMLAEARNYLRVAWWIGVWPGLAITLTVISISVLGRRWQLAFEGRRQS